MKVQRLFIYPVKGLPGCEVQSAVIGKTGLESDRRFMLADRSGRFISQREYPQLARLRIIENGGSYFVRSPLSEMALHVPTEASTEVRVSVWSDDMLALDCGNEAAQFFSEFLHDEVRLVYMSSDVARLTGGALRFEHVPVSFADACPILVINTASLSALSESVGGPMVAERFRPNIVIDSDQAWFEDEWQELMLGPVELMGVKTCGRCHVINIDPVTALAGQEPLRTLSRLRNFGNRVVFGTYFMCNAIGSEIRTGDGVVLKTRGQLNPQ